MGEVPKHARRIELAREGTGLRPARIRRGTKMATFSPAFSTLSGATQVRIEWRQPWFRKSHSRTQSSVFASWIAVRLLLQIVWKHNCANAPITDRYANGAVDQMPHLGRRCRLLHERPGDVLEHADEVHFLLVVTADRITRLLAKGSVTTTVARRGLPGNTKGSAG